MIWNSIYGRHAFRFVIVIAALVVMTGGGEAATITVDDSGGADYARIQDAINNATAGDTILVYSGTYYENVNIDRQLTLRAIGMPVVDARGSGSAITLAANGITLEGFTATRGGSYPVAGAGIKVTSNNNTLIGNNASSNGDIGIHISSSSNNTLIGNNANSNYYDGILLVGGRYSSNNTLIGNNASSNKYWGIFLQSSNNTLTNNIMKGNSYNFELNRYSDFNNQIDTSNLVDGKPVYYIKGAVDTVYDSSTNAGTFYCISCVNVTLKNLDLKNNGNGILFWNTTNSKIQNVDASNNYNGILLIHSDNNTLSGNNANSSSYYGISLESHSNNNTLIGNSATSSNDLFGIVLGSSSNNVLTNNIMKGNKYNFGLGGGSDSDFNNQIDTSNLVDGKPVYYIKGAADTVYDSSTNAGTFYCISCVNVTLKNIDLKNNNNGIFFWNTTNSKIQNVTASNNSEGIYLDSSSNNTLNGNNVSNNAIGIFIFSSYDNKIFHNNLINKQDNVIDFGGWGNSWYSGYPSGGNYWSDYTGVDLKSGSSQNLTGSDGIGDTPYTISGGAGAQDLYPFIKQNGWISAVTKGDVSGDGQVTVVDALFIAQYTVGLRSLSSQQLAAADINNDGQVNIVDALFIAQYTVGLRQL